jgi:hypothetical protein
MTQKRQKIVVLALIIVIGLATAQCGPTPERVVEPVVVEKEVVKEVEVEEVAMEAPEVEEEEVTTGEPEEGRILPADDELQAAIHEVVEVSNQAQIEALRTLSLDPLLETNMGEALQSNEEWIGNLRADNQYVVAQLESLEMTSVGILEPGQRAVATTVENWAEMEFYNLTDDTLAGTRPPVLYYETYFMIFDGARWKVEEIIIREQLSLTLVNIVGSVFVDGELTVKSREIFPGNKIETGDDGYASLLYPDGGITHLGSGTSLQLLELEPASARRAPGLASPLAIGGSFAKFWQDVGDTWNQVKNTVICGLTGCTEPTETNFAVHVAAEDGSMRVEVFEGVVKVTSVDFPDQPVFVEKEEQTLIRPGQLPLEPFPIDEPPLEFQPDLVVTTLEMTGPATINPEGGVEVPILVVIKNQGGAEADVFKISTEYTGPSGTFLVPFTVPGQGDIWYASTSAPLGPGMDVTFAGNVTFQSALQGQTISLKAMADSCAGDEFMRDFCRVEESNEDNNESTPISVSLPSIRPPEVTITNPGTDSGTSDTQYAYDGSDEALGLWYKDVVLQGSAIDPEDGALSGSSLVWTTDRQDVQDPFLGTGTNVTVRLYSNQCTGVWHEITLTATDSHGNTSRAVRRIFIWTLC